MYELTSDNKCISGAVVADTPKLAEKKIEDLHRDLFTTASRIKLVITAIIR